LSLVVLQQRRFSEKLGKVVTDRRSEKGGEPHFYSNYYPDIKIRPRRKPCRLIFVIFVGTLRADPAGERSEAWH